MKIATTKTSETQAAPKPNAKPTENTNNVVKVAQNKIKNRAINFFIF